MLFKVFRIISLYVNYFRSLTKNETVAAKNTAKYLAVLIDRILIWKYHTPFVVDKLCIAKNILSKFIHYAAISVLKNVLYSITYLHLHYSVTIMETCSSKIHKKIKTQQKFNAKVISKVPFFKTKLSPIYHHLNYSTLTNIFKLEVLKFVYKFKKIVT